MYNGIGGVADQPLTDYEIANKQVEIAVKCLKINVLSGTVGEVFTIASFLVGHNRGYRRVHAHPAYDPGQLGKIHPGFWRSFSGRPGE